MQRLTLLALSAVTLASKSSGFVLNQPTMRVNIASAFLMFTVFGQGQHKKASAGTPKSLIEESETSEEGSPEEKDVTVYFTNSVSRPVEVYWNNPDLTEGHYKVIPLIMPGESANISSHRGHLFDVYYYPGVDVLFDPVQSFEITEEDANEEHFIINFNEKEHEERRALGVKAIFRNRLDFPLEVFWVDHVDGGEKKVASTIESGKDGVVTTHPGYFFKVYPAGLHETNNPVKFVEISARSGEEYYVMVDNPKEEEERQERRKNMGLEAHITNKLDRAVKIYWIDPETQEKYLQTTEDIPPGKTTWFKTHPGHTFHVYHSGEEDTHDPVTMFQMTAGYGRREQFEVEL
eukprot:CAMPEP_0195522700 /NCGR_PEP_ID=MMETSP0794_2-20130614/21124_1 /TAXON_ID=515487 /ORGANISM="Stephanopyxis turris, Strain CCMP 815" /LENGTH=347 /DNA_ID=CAMNT_0040652521 /DNA_START=41 /DNA_END=1084 /DNA_ORIENTATION=+